MADYVTLVGAEDVRAAGNRIASAASEMNGAAGSIEGALRQHQMFLDGWLMRFEIALSTSATKGDA